MPPQKAVADIEFCLVGEAEVTKKLQQICFDGANESGCGQIDQYIFHRVTSSDMINPATGAAADVPQRNSTFVLALAVLPLVEVCLHWRLEGLQRLPPEQK
jgi:hypothetical protein